MKERIKPGFWDHHDVAAGPYKHLFDFRRIWRQAVVLTCVVALVPLVFMAVIDFNVTRKAVDSEISFRVSRLVSNTRRTVRFFLEERVSALAFVVKDNSIEELTRVPRLFGLLENLKRAFGGFTDLGVIDSKGIQRVYAGPYDFYGVDYSGQEWYRHVLQEGVYVSDVFLGLRQVPHIVIALKHVPAGGSPYVVRATIDTERFQEVLAQLEMSEQGDAFLVNREGILQTPSRYFGNVLKKLPIPVPHHSEHSQVTEMRLPQGTTLMLGYAYIDQTPFILMITKNKKDLIKEFHYANLKIFAVLAVSIVCIVVVIVGVSTYLVEQIHEADQRRVAMLHQVEYSNKMASIGRLAAGVAHEINNPLAIINEKAGLIRDLFTFRKMYAEDERLLRLVNSILQSVERGANITRRLLSFARHMGGESIRETLHPAEVVQEVIGFLQKEAEHRSITISVHVAEDVPAFVSDRGKLQQILLNLMNNAFAAVQDGGAVDIEVVRENRERILMTVADNGSGIAEADVQRIFEPFFSTKTKQGGTGLGLSITYGLVQELGGQIQVASTVGKGTTFTIRLPLNHGPEGEPDESATGG